MAILDAPPIPVLHASGYYESEHPSTASTPFVSAPSSPGRNSVLSGYYFSAPASPSREIGSVEEVWHAGCLPTAMAGTPARKSDSDLDAYAMEDGRNADCFPAALTIPGSCSRCKSDASDADDHSPHSLTGSDFEFSARFLYLEEPPMSPTPMSSANDIFFNGQIRAFYPPPLRQQPFSFAGQLTAADGGSFAGCSVSAPLSPPSLKYQEHGVIKGDVCRISNLHQEVLDPSVTAMEEMQKSDMGNSHPRARSFSPLKMFNSDEMAAKLPVAEKEGEPARKTEKKFYKRSQKWTLKGLLQRNGRDTRVQNQDSSRRWSDAFSSRQSSRGSRRSESSQSSVECEKDRLNIILDSQGSSKLKPSNGNAAGIKSSVRPQSPHELHYTKQRAQTEEMKKRTFLPYRQGLLGCLGFSSKSYRAMTNISLQPVS